MSPQRARDTSVSQRSTRAAARECLSSRSRSTSRPWCAGTSRRLLWCMWRTPGLGTRKRTCLCKATTSNRMGRLTFLGLCSSARLIFALSAFAYVMHGRLRAPSTLIRCYYDPGMRLFWCYRRHTTISTTTTRLRLWKTLSTLRIGCRTRTDSTQRTSTAAT